VLVGAAGPDGIDDQTGADEHQPRLGHPVVEKLALVGLVAAIFVNVLGIGASGVQIAGATALLVLVTAGVSQLLATRGVEWPSLGLQFVVLAVVNTTLIGIFARLVGERDLNRAAAWFFGLLLTMIIVLFDRFRADHLRRVAAPPSGSA
jgi:hypothetical protein